MNAGNIAAVLWDAAVWFFLLSVFVFPVSLAMWKAREKQRAEETEETLESLGFDHSHRFEQDAL